MKKIRNLTFALVAVVALGLGFVRSENTSALSLSLQNVSALGVETEAEEPPMSRYSCEPTTSNTCTIRLNEVLIQGIGQPVVIY